MYIMHARSSDTKEQIVGFVSRLYLDWYQDVKALIILWKKRINMMKSATERNKNQYCKCKDKKEIYRNFLAGQICYS